MAALRGGARPSIGQARRLSIQPKTARLSAWRLTGKETGPRESGRPKDMYLEQSMRGRHGRSRHSRARGACRSSIVTRSLSMSGAYISTGSYPDYQWDTVRLPGSGQYDVIGDLRYVTDSIAYAINSERLFRSDDGGASWQQVWQGANTLERIANRGHRRLGCGLLRHDHLQRWGVWRFRAPRDPDQLAFLVGRHGCLCVALALDRTGIDSTWWAIGEPAPATAAAASTSHLAALTTGLSYMLTRAESRSPPRASRRSPSTRGT